ncbi:MAG: alpha-glucosidase C-terminal domain-containing protein, partial [Akkermansiaceae bacterium]|nr:alpha-glucosidase C-terminal domain-containing protein [Armatimonadota bacterium]
DINPELGTKDDFRRLVKRAHALGLRVLMDWVPNHTAWDNPMIDMHPDFYVRDDKGQVQQAGPWADVAQLDYGKLGRWNQPLWDRMRDDMALWVREFAVDGFRCDVAGRGGKVPVDFWRWLRPQLDAIRPIFMLGEADDAYLHPAFDMTFSWNLPPVLWDICAGRLPASAIDDVLRKEAREYPPGAIRMRFLDNHDWHGHADWGWGDKPAIDTRGGMPQVAPLMVLCTTLPGKPLVYNGQETSFARANPPLQAEARRHSSVWPFYRRLLQLYQSQPAISGGNFTRLSSECDNKVYAFSRQHGGNRALVAVNLSNQVQTATLRDSFPPGTYKDWFGDRKVTLSAALPWKLAPWEYRVYTQ